MKAHTISSVPMTFEEVGKEGEEVVGKERRWERRWGRRWRRMSGKETW